MIKTMYPKNSPVHVNKSRWIIARFGIEQTMMIVMKISTGDLWNKYFRNRWEKTIEQNNQAQQDYLEKFYKLTPHTKV